MSTAVDISARAQTLGIKTQFKDLRGGTALLLPQRIAVVGQGATASTYSTTKAQYSSAADVGSAYGFGSPLHLAAKQLFPDNGDGVGTIPVTFYPLDDDGSGVAAAGDITPAGSQTVAASYRINVNNILSEPFTISVGDTVADICDAITAAVNAVLDMPVVAVDNTTDVGLAAKWKGTSSNDIVVSVVGSATAGTTFAITQPTGGLVNPDVQTALDQVGNVWETMLLSCFEADDTTILGDYAAFNEGRWGPLVRKPLIAFSGSNETTVASATAVPDARKTDRTNCQLVSPASSDLPVTIAARQLARIAVQANNNPPVDYVGLNASGLTPGADGSQWLYSERDEALKKGSSTIEVIDSVVKLSDTVTFYHPDGDAFPAYRFVVDVIKLQNILYNLDLIFSSPGWAGAPLVPDDQPTTNPAARQPKAAVAAINALIDSLGNLAIISDPATAKAATAANISSQNPKRLDVSLTLQLSGNIHIISVDFNFGFFFGSAN